MSEARENNFETLLTITLKQQKIIEQLEQQNKEMLEALKFIKEFGYNNPGCGFSCAKVADNTIESITNKIIDE